MKLFDLFGRIVGYTVIAGVAVIAVFTGMAILKIFLGVAASMLSTTVGTLALGWLIWAAYKHSKKSNNGNEYRY